MRTTTAVLLLLCATLSCAGANPCGRAPEIRDPALRRQLEEGASRIFRNEVAARQASALVKDLEIKYPKIAKQDDLEGFLKVELCLLAWREIERNATSKILPVGSEPGKPLADLFPWPPPTPSTRRSFSPDVTTGADPARTAGEVASRLEKTLKDAEFDTWGYYRVPGGFALVTRIERIDENSGKPLSGATRWSTQLAYGGLRFSSIFAVSRPKGHYRILVFILTDDPPMTKVMDGAATFEIAARWALEGRSSLPPVVREQPVGQNHELVLLIYEFEQVQGGQASIFRPSRWSADLHIQSIGPGLKSRQ